MTFRTFAAVLGLLVATTAWGNDAPLRRAPPPGFKPLHDIVDLPHILPDLGELYVDPARLPRGPLIGYDRNGRLVGATYRLRRPEDEQAARDELKQMFPDLTVQHVDREKAMPHPGGLEVHEHATFWFISHDEHLIYLK